MRVINEGSITGYFGGIEDNLKKSDHYALANFVALQKKIPCASLFFLKQVHGKVVYVLNECLEQSIILFENEGDAIITKEKKVAIGIVTADCLPIFLYDDHNKAIGAIHAGWKGLSLGLITETIEKMKMHFNTNPKHLKVYLGPSADQCCYEVQPDFLSHFSNAVFDDSMIEKRAGSIFFNPKKYALCELVKNGLLLSNVNTQHHVCTICHTDFCSFRREKALAGRQPSIIYLKE